MLGGDSNKSPNLEACRRLRTPKWACLFVVFEVTEGEILTTNTTVFCFYAECPVLSSIPSLVHVHHPPPCPQGASSPQDKPSRQKLERHANSHDHNSSRQEHDSFSRNGRIHLTSRGPRLNCSDILRSSHPVHLRRMRVVFPGPVYDQLEPFMPCGKTLRMSVAAA